MKPNVEFPKKVKNSFIFFQLGLIATMLVVLFVLEFNFELKPKEVITVETTPTLDISFPTDFRKIPESKPLADKPVVASKFKNQFKATTKDVPKEKINPVETPTLTEVVAPIESTI